MVSTKLTMIFSQKDVSRLEITEVNPEHLKITVDVHGMRCSEARRFINNIICIVNMDCQLVIIHGYNHGTAIKEMLLHNFNNKHIYERSRDSKNQGITYMLIAA